MEKGKKEEMGNNRDNYCHANWGVGGQFQKRTVTSTPGIKILVVPQFSYLPDQILRKK